MRSRTLREGSVGLLLLVGLAAFGGIVLWLNRFTAAQKSYKIFADFADAGGMQKGSQVRYRGVKVGNITQIKPRANVVEVEIEITQPDLIIPKNVDIQANQSGLISESIVDITPRTPLPQGIALGKPSAKDCNNAVIVCNGSHVKGEIGISVDQLIRDSTQLTELYTQPTVYKNINDALKNTSLAAQQVAVLSRNFSTLATSTQQQLGSLSSTTNSVQRAANTISISTKEAADKITTSSTKTVSQFGVTAKDFSATAKQLSSTASQAGNLTKNLNDLLVTNRSSLVATLNNITDTSNQLKVTVSSLSPAVNRLTKGQLLQNLEALSANAAQASANFRDISKSFKDPNNALVLQKTLDSARVTFENTQKITSDLDELTGDPNFRRNLRQLVNGLSHLVSSTQQMQQQVQVAAALDTVQTNVNQTTSIPNPDFNSQQIVINSSPTTGKETFSSSQENLIQLLRDEKNLRKRGR